jgi:hypothetical protein
VLSATVRNTHPSFMRPPPIVSQPLVKSQKPTDRERTQWYFQRYVNHLPAAGEMVFFDRSWYNRGGVERVMGSAPPGFGRSGESHSGRSRDQSDHSPPCRM